jgi:hypothetical protein
VASHYCFCYIEVLGALAFEALAIQFFSLGFVFFIFSIILLIFLYGGCSNTMFVKISRRFFGRDNRQSWHRIHRILLGFCRRGVGVPFS